jgi:hypothetical protein
VNKAEKLSNTGSSGEIGAVGLREDRTIDLAPVDIGKSGIRRIEVSHPPTP